MDCPCGRGRYDTCCAPLHAGARAPDAEALMRSRYSAYALGLADYLLASWHPSTRPATLELHNDPPLVWLGLDVKRHTASGDTATVEFVARYRQGGGRAGRSLPDILSSATLARPARRSLPDVLSSATLARPARRSLPDVLSSATLARPARRLHEISRFVHERQQWFYLDGDVATD